MQAVSLNGKALQFATEELKGDRKIVMAAVSNNGFALLFATEELRGDRKIVMAAVSQNGRALQFAVRELRGPRDSDGSGMPGWLGAPICYRGAERRSCDRDASDV